MYGLLQILIDLPRILISEVFAHKELVYTRVVLTVLSFRASVRAFARYLISKL